MVDRGDDVSRLEEIRDRLAREYVDPNRAPTSIRVVDHESVIEDLRYLLSRITGVEGERLRAAARGAVDEADQVAHELFTGRVRSLDVAGERIDGAFSDLRDALDEDRTVGEAEDPCENHPEREAAGHTLDDVGLCEECAPTDGEEGAREDRYELKCPKCGEPTGIQTSYPADVLVQAERIWQNVRLRTGREGRDDG